jgi:hypothetical protein
MKWKYDAETANVTEKKSLIVARIVAPSDGPLIAAAPDMLAALRALVAECETLTNDDYADTPLDDAVKKARAVIARAECGK